MRTIICLCLCLCTISLLKHYGDYGMLKSFEIDPLGPGMQILFLLASMEDLLTVINKLIGRKGRNEG